MTDGMFPPESDDYIWGDKWDQGVDEGLSPGWQEELYIEIDSPWGFQNNLSIEEWHHIVTDFTDDEILADYGLHNLTIIRELENMGYWNDEDWEIWRNAYEEQSG